MVSRKNTAQTRPTSEDDHNSKPIEEASKEEKVQAIEHPVKDDFTAGSDFITLNEELLEGYTELALRLFRQCVEELPPNTMIKSPEAWKSINALKLIFEPVISEQKKDIANSLEDLAWNMGCQLPVISDFNSGLKLHDDRSNNNDEIVLEECKRGIIAFISEANRCLSMELSSEETNKALRKHQNWYLDLYRKRQNAELLDIAVRELTDTGTLSEEDQKKFNNWSVQCLFFIAKEDHNKSEEQSEKARYPWRERYDQLEKPLDPTHPLPLKAIKQQPMEREIMDDDHNTSIDLNSSFVDAADSKALGEAIRSARLNAGLSQSQLKARTSMSIRTISRLETGKGGITLKALSEIANATNAKIKVGFIPK